MGTLAEQNRGRVWGITVRVIVMARQQTQSSKDNDPGCLLPRHRGKLVRKVGEIDVPESEATATLFQ